MVTELRAAKPADPGLAVSAPSRAGGRARGHPRRSLTLSRFSFFSSARRVSPPPHARPGQGTSFFLDLSLALRVPVPLQTRNARSLHHLSPLSPDSAPGSAGSPSLGHRGRRCPPQAPPQLAPRTGLNPPLISPRLVPLSPTTCRRSHCFAALLTCGPAQTCSAGAAAD